MTSCDPSPGAPNNCPAGFHCTPDGHCDAFCTPGGDECGDGYKCTSDGQCIPTGNIVACEKMGMPPTTISGTVFAPNGTLPLFGVDVFVPSTDPGMLPPGAQCSRCNDELPGNPIVQTKSLEDGTFSITDAPSGPNIPVVVQIGKWRKQFVMPTVNQCTDNPIGAMDARLPATKAEGDIPLIAITTGSADALECLVRKLGIADSEIGTAGGAQRIHLYADTGAGVGEGVASFAGGFGGGSGPFANATSLWNDQNAMKAYDILIFSCEGAQHSETKSQAAMNAVKAYADIGGRVFMSHWHNIWIEGATQDGTGQKPPVWSAPPPNDIATFNDGAPNPPDPTTDIIDEANNPKGVSFATWMLNVMGSTTRDQLPIIQGRATCATVNNAKAERWVYHQGDMLPQNFQFTTPNEAGADMRCGKVVFSDMHVSGDSSSPTGGTYPTTCSTMPLTPQEKALAFMFFDIASCVDVIF
jgi:hypothetical protein